MISFQNFKDELLQNSEVAAIYKANEPNFKLAQALIQARLDKKITQKELAEKVGTKQPSISRLESGDYNPSLEFLKKVASALDKKLVIGFI